MRDPAITTAPHQSRDRHDGDERVPVAQSLASYAAVSVYFSFLFHILTLAGLIGGLWALNQYYLEEYESVDPIRAALADEIVLDDDPLTETVPLDIAPLNTLEVKEDTAASIARSISEDALNAAQVLNTFAGSAGSDGGNWSLCLDAEGANAVTKGSFTAWTDPANPAAGEAYSIVIEVKLPASFKIYRLTDLKGKVVGSDKYVQRLPWDSIKAGMYAGCGWPYMMRDNREFKVGRNQRIRVRENKIQTRIKVPGAREKVRDLITIRSEKLKEEQEIELLFGK